MPGVVGFSAATRHSPIFHAPSLLRLVAASLMALAVLPFAATSAFAQTLSLSTNAVCVNTPVTVTVTPGSGENCPYPAPTASVGGTNVVLEPNSNGTWSGTITMPAPNSYGVAGSDGCSNCPSTNLLVFQLNGLTITGATSIDSTNYATVRTPTNNYVTITARVYPNDTNAAALITWSTNVTPLSANPLQVRVSTTTSAQTPVTASCCNAFYSNDVWVIWANLSINVSGPLDPDDHVSVLVQGSTWPTPTSFNDNFTPYGNGFGGGNGLGAIDCISDTNLNYCYTIGKMEAKAVPQPLGIVNIIPSNNWNLRRTVVCAFFTNATLAYSSGGKIPPTNQDDTSFAAMLYFNTTNGDFFDLDTPGCPVTFGTNIPYTAETYANFWEYMTVTLGGAPVVCSPSNTYSYVSTINTNATPSAQTNVLSPALINVRTNSVYRPR